MARPRLVAIVEDKEAPHAELYRVYLAEAGDILGEEELQAGGLWSLQEGKRPLATPQKMQVLELDAILAGEENGVRRYWL